MTEWRLRVEGHSGCVVRPPASEAPWGVRWNLHVKNRGGLVLKPGELTCRSGSQLPLGCHMTLKNMTAKNKGSEYLNVNAALLVQVKVGCQGTRI